MDLDGLEVIVKEARNDSYLLNNEKIFWAMFYTIPIFHNPTGMTLPAGTEYLWCYRTLSCSCDL